MQIKFAAIKERDHRAAGLSTLLILLYAGRSHLEMGLCTVMEQRRECGQPSLPGGEVQRRVAGHVHLAHVDLVSCHLIAEPITNVVLWIERGRESLS